MEIQQRRLGGSLQAARDTLVMKGGGQVGGAEIREVGFEGRDSWGLNQVSQAEAKWVALGVWGGGI